MIDISRLRTDTLAVSALLKKDPSFPVDQLLAFDKKVRELTSHVELLRSQKNDLAHQAKTGITDAIREESMTVGKDLKEKEAELKELSDQCMALALTCPNLAADDIPEGNKEENVVVREFGKKPTFSFSIKHHQELAAHNKWFSFETGANVARSGFVWYDQAGARVLYALAFFMLKNNKKHGFEVTLPPAMANEQTLTVASNFPKFKEEVFTVAADGLYAIPTAEVSLVNKYRDTIIPTAELPIRLTAWTSCFRREVGNYGKMERGLIRIHQFEKVELVSFCEPEKSGAEQDRMIACAEDILQQLGLHYRVSLLAGQDCSFASAKTYDIEVWLPGQEKYYEVSSASNCTDFQARRGKIRYRKEAGEKTELVHTLNASSLALPRLMVALMETYQQPDGSIVLPKVLDPYLL
jgi:seryl-tRNA synthetase